MLWIALEFVLRQIRAMTDFCNSSNVSLFVSALSVVSFLVGVPVSLHAGEG
jgi:hypothetical protein